MKRRTWLTLAGRAGWVTLCAGCAPVKSSGGLDPAAVRRLSGDAYGFYGIWKNGKSIGSRGAGERMPSLSITKSLAALAVVRAVGEGWLKLDRPLDDIVPEWRAEAGKRLVTVRMLVNQTAGFSSGVAALYRGAIADKGRAAIALPLVDPPGQQFRYGAASSEILAEVLRRGLRKRGTSLEKFLGEIMDQIGISSPDWRKDLAGNFYLSTGAQFSVRDLGQLGKIVASLAAGSSTEGLSARIFRDLAAPRFANPMVAAGLWWNRNATQPGAFAIEPERNIDAVRPPAFWRNACLGPDLDPGWLALVGSGGKRVYVLPSRGLVVARLGRSAHWNDGAFLRAITV